MSRKPAYYRATHRALRTTIRKKAAAFDAHPTADKQNPKAKNWRSFSSPEAMASALAPQQKAKIVFAAWPPVNAQSVKNIQIILPMINAATSRVVGLTSSSNGNSHSDQIAAKINIDCVIDPRTGLDW
jgi:hypothetical protein